MEHTTIALDLAKSVFQVAVLRRPGHIDEERRLARARFLTYIAQQRPATVVLEACGSAHYWGRQLQPLGHAVRLLPAHNVHRYVVATGRIAPTPGAARGESERGDSSGARQERGALANRYE